MKNKFGIVSLVIAFMPVIVTMIFPEGLNVFSKRIYNDYLAAVILMLPFFTVATLLFFSFKRKENKIFPVAAVIISILPFTIFSIVGHINFNKEIQQSNLRPPSNVGTNSCKIEYGGVIYPGYFQADFNSAYFFDGHRNILVKGVDADSFECLEANRTETGGWLYGKDKNNVYFGPKMLEGADPDSFEVLKFGYYAKDKNKAWANGVLLADADGASFEFFFANSGNGVPFRFAGKDKNNVYINNVKLQNSDSKTFSDVGERLYGYSKDKNNVYFYDAIIPGADPETFVPVAQGVYYKDKNFVYYKNKVLESADVATFKAITGAQSWYAYDKNNYYKNDQAVAEATSPDLRVVNGEYLLFGNRLFWKDESIFISNPQNLAYVAAGYLKDGRSVYSTKTEPFGAVEGVLPEEFAVYPTGMKELYFIRKGNNISLVNDYLDYDGFRQINEREIPGAYADTFYLYKWPYAKDAYNVYYTQAGIEGYFTQEIEGADSLTFKFLMEDNGPSASAFSSRYYGADKSSVYLGATKLKDSDPGDFKLQNFKGYKYPLGISNGNVYFFTQKLDGIDPEKITFEQSGSIIRDNNTAWYIKCLSEGMWYVSESEINDPASYKANEECLWWLEQHQ